MISHSAVFPAIPFASATRSRLSPVSLDVQGRTQVEGWPTALRRSVWTTTTGRIFPGSVTRGLRSARYSAPCSTATSTEPFAREVIEVLHLPDCHLARRERGVPIRRLEGLAARRLLQQLQAPANHVDVAA